MTRGVLRPGLVSGSQERTRVLAEQPASIAPVPRSSNTSVIAIAMAVLLVVVVVVAVLATLAISGFRRYTTNGKMAEGRITVAVIAKGIARCSTPRGSVPESSGAVPADLSSVSGRKYLSAPSEWSHQAFRCAGFSMREPQYFRYQWLRESDAAGVVRAEADLDGDGAAEIRLEHEVVCGASGCQSAMQAKETEL